MKLITKLFKMLGNLIVVLFVCAIGIIEIVIKGIIPIWNGQKSGYVWFGALYQPIVILFSCIPIISQIENVAKSNDSKLFWIILITFEMLIFTFFINILIELLFYLANKESTFDNIQELQKYSNNYALIIISLFSLLVSVLPDIVPFDNLYLLIAGFIFFASTVSSDTYRIFIYSKGGVKELAQKVKSISKDC